MPYSGVKLRVGHGPKSAGVDLVEEVTVRDDDITPALAPIGGQYRPSVEVLVGGPGRVGARVVRKAERGWPAFLPLPS